jgi:hypothetical protein
MTSSFLLFENICKPRKLAHERVVSLFVAKCESCGARLDGHSLVMQASLIMMGQGPDGCPACGHGYLVVEVSGLTAEEEARLKQDRFFSTLATPKGGG